MGRQEGVKSLYRGLTGASLFLKYIYICILKTENIRADVYEDGVA
jgi:hypothetical protein